MSQRYRVVVVQGGPSVEAEVSRVSARGVATALAEAGHEAVRMELDPFLAESIRSGGYDAVFPVTHGAVGEDGCLQGLLEVLSVPYVGSGVLACALAMDKRAARRVFEAEGLPVPRGIALAKGDAKAAATRARKEIGARLVVKPASGGSAIGVTRLTGEASDDDVARAFEEAWTLDAVAIAEHFAVGREVTCGVLEDEAGPRALPPTEIRSPKHAFYTYEARYAAGQSEHQCPAPLPPVVSMRVQEVALAAHRALGCRDLSRVDFVVGDIGDPDAVFLIEVNALPGFTGTSLFPEAARVAGLSFSVLCDALLRAAVRRGPTRRNAPRPFPT